MSRALVRGATGLLVGASIVFAFVPLARAGGETTTQTPTVEAWYQPNPTCANPLSCLALSPLPAAAPPALQTRAFPAGTLHVGVTGGRETARSYLAFGPPLASLASRIIGASLDVPLDNSAQDGSVSPDTAQLQVCTFSGSLTPAAGSIDTPPSTSCDVNAPVSYVAAPTPHLHADLRALTDSLPIASGLALLPDATKVAQTDAWRVVFSAHDRSDAATTAPAALRLEFSPPPDGQGGVAPIRQPTSQTGFPVTAPLAGTGFAAPPATMGEQPALPVQAAPQAVVVVMPTAGTIRLGYAYPIVWLLPLVFLVVVPMAARALVKDLTPQG